MPSGWDEVAEILSSGHPSQGGISRIVIPAFRADLTSHVALPCLKIDGGTGGQMRVDHVDAEVEIVAADQLTYRTRHSNHHGILPPIRDKEVTFVGRVSLLAIDEVVAQQAVPPILGIGDCVALLNVGEELPWLFVNFARHEGAFALVREVIQELSMFIWEVL